jgi:hypothetical protein
MLPAVGDFLKGTFGESLKKPLQPAGIVPASILLLLNVVLVFPALVDQGQPVALALRELGGVGQAVLVMAAVLSLSYLLLGLTGSILKLMTGELWADSPFVGPLLKQHQSSNFLGLKHKIWERNATTPHGRVQRSRSLLRLTTDYPPNRDMMEPTTLGNVLQATVAYLWQRYGIDMQALWPHMETIVADNDPLASRINDEKATLDFLLNMTLVLYLFGFEHLTIRFLLRQWPDALWSVCFLALGWATYGAATGKARAWSASIQQAFDLYRDNLRKALHIRPFLSLQDEKEVWQRVSRWLLWGEPPSDVFDPTGTAPCSPPSRLTLTHSDNVQVELAERIPFVLTCAHSEHVRCHAVKYVLLVTRRISDSQLRTEHSTNAAYVAVTDTEVSSPSEAPLCRSASPWKFKQMPIAEGGKGQTLLWSLDHVPLDGAEMLEYDLPTAHIRMHCNKSGLELVAPVQETPRAGLLEREYDLTFTCRGGIPRGARVGVSDTRIRAPGQCFRWVAIGDNAPALIEPDGPTPASALSDQHICRWTINEDLQQGTAVRLGFLVAKPGAEMSPRLKDVLGTIWFFDGIPRPKQLRTWEYADRADVIRALLGTRTYTASSSPADRVKLLNNQGCIWMLLAEWDLAEAILRRALQPDLTIPKCEETGKPITYVKVSEPPPPPPLIKQAVDENLDLLTYARSAWLLGSTAPAGGVEWS